MAVTDIPEYIEVAPGDLIRSDDWNSVQRQARNSIRVHRHTRVEGAPVDDTATDDNALQATTAEITDGAITDAQDAPPDIPYRDVPRTYDVFLEDACITDVPPASRMYSCDPFATVSGCAMSRMPVTWQIFS